MSLQKHTGSHGNSFVEVLDEIISEFLIESYESLDQLDRDLLALEEASDDHERLSSVFRTIHTIKGTSGFLAFQKLERLTHVGENLLVSLRDGELKLDNEIADALLAMVDAVRTMLNSIESGKGEGSVCHDDLIATLERLKHGGPATAVEIEASEVVAELSEPKESKPAAKKPAARKPRRSRKAATKKKASRRSNQQDAAPEQAPAESVDRDEETVPVTPPAGGSSATSELDSCIADSTVRIDVHLLDKLMNLVGELVLARNQIVQISDQAGDTAMSAAAQRVNLITTELQEGVMKTRMQPIRNAWSKLPRVVRDLSHSCGKRVQLRMEGAGTELDKTILEAIRDPLTHIVRNSVDHGIEAPDVRKAAGKPEEGTLLLRACHEGGQVIIEIIDDGAGIDTERVRQTAVARKIITAEAAADLSEREAMQLILQPGFSTAQQVTNVSGRGVGMDVVKTNVEKIGGNVDVQTVPGEGTTLRIKIPLTLAIVPALVVTAAEDRYCIPQVSLLELVRLDGDRVRTDVEMLHSVPIYRLRGQLLPLVYLDEELGLRARRTKEERFADESVNIVVLQAEDRQFGLIVDDISDTQEIVVKPLGSHLKSLTAYAGSTIMGDGAVSLILDVIGIAQQASVLTGRASAKCIETPPQDHAANCVRNSWLVVEPRPDTQAAIPLSSVARLEEIPVADIENVENRQVVQYRGEIMPLTSIAEFGRIDPVDGAVSVVVYNSAGRNVGIGVGRIVDIVSDNEAAQADAEGGTRIIAGKVTEIIDLERVTSGVL